MNADLIYTHSGGTKVKVICKGQDQIQGHTFPKNCHLWGISVSQVQHFFLFTSYCSVKRGLCGFLAYVSLHRLQRLTWAQTFFYPLVHSHTMIPFDAPGKQAF